MNTSLQDIQVTINGEARAVSNGLTVSELLTSLGLHPRLIVVEHNREILNREQYDKTEVRAGDAFELVHFVGGG
ncbi:MAG TPA: sulfur carrier protein ThiS [Longimicrobiales bacterium]|nr:sulfur carrier protein ThiS [Longimicrobiales bacterium]